MRKVAPLFGCLLLVLCGASEPARVQWFIEFAGTSIDKGKPEKDIVFYAQWKGDDFKDEKQKVPSAPLPTTMQSKGFYSEVRWGFARAGKGEMTVTLRQGGADGKVIAIRKVPADLSHVDEVRSSDGQVYASGTLLR